MSESTPENGTETCPDQLSRPETCRRDPCRLPSWTQPEPTCSPNQRKPPLQAGRMTCLILFDNSRTVNHRLLQSHIVTHRQPSSVPSYAPPKTDQEDESSPPGLPPPNDAVGRHFRPPAKTMRDMQDLLGCREDRATPAVYRAATLSGRWKTSRHLPQQVP
ncbi:hypothetical protein PtA15_12A243 [Puccinia triticina]|uniref:C2H2-type domain-containing protein n=1 Tax=Puccinia triticina TaxID=208348 RepID=A0ABY7D034_9BASI|nr:uncharacterized protein PtA15_12A243 [Puccinia triticina]WAQ90255.1 hypothetical protein PtA15_12A243 [Puccinia triticina]WAR61563.1 hypothetical protein PtB15_12B253 [Puccinia triticina]